jgi:hypothetical protein
MYHRHRDHELPENKLDDLCCANNTACAALRISGMRGYFCHLSILNDEGRTTRLIKCSGAPDYKPRTASSTGDALP